MGLADEGTLSIGYLTGGTYGKIWKHARVIGVIRINGGSVIIGPKLNCSREQVRREMTATKNAMTAAKYALGKGDGFPTERRPEQRHLTEAPLELIEAWFNSSGINLGKMADTSERLGKAKRMLFTWRDRFATNVRHIKATDLPRATEATFRGLSNSGILLLVIPGFEVIFAFIFGFVLCALNNYLMFEIYRDRVFTSQSSNILLLFFCSKVVKLFLSTIVKHEEEPSITLRKQFTLPTSREIK